MKDTRASEARKYCEAASKREPGKTCKLRAGHGTSHPGIGYCSFHGGNTPAHKRAGELGMAKREANMLGLPVEIDPGQALILNIWECQGNVEFYRRMVQQLAEHPEPPQLVEATSGPEDGQVERVEIPAIYGPTYHVSGRATGEAKPHILVVLYNQERDRLREACAAALRAGVEERRVRLAETDAAAILQAQVNTLVAMGLSDRLDEFRLMFIKNLRPASDLPAPPALGAGEAA